VVYLDKRLDIRIFPGGKNYRRGYNKTINSLQRFFIMRCKIIKGGDTAKIGTISESISGYTGVKYFEISITDSGKPYFCCSCSSMEHAEHIADKNKCSKIYYID
jgi:hypothetical protein